MSSRAIILGCSHASGAEMDREPGLGLQEDTYRWQYGARHSYPALIAESLGLIPRNHAISGGSNDAMFRIFESLLPTLTSSDVVIACWTGGSRTEVWNDVAQQWLPFQASHNEFYRTKPDEYMLEGMEIPRPVANAAQYKEYQKYWISYNNSQVWSRLNKIKNIIALNTVAHLYNIQVINIDSFDPIFSKTLNFPEYVYWPVPTTFCSWADGLNSPRTENVHYFYPTHKKFAEYVVDSINNR